MSQRDDREVSSMNGYCEYHNNNDGFTMVESNLSLSNEKKKKFMWIKVASLRLCHLIKRCRRDF